ncbi:hypothetical protein MMC26_001607 [Xylographa opegraphella]|nr:hypothetical protein [Xylographa opegraphella]
MASKNSFLSLPLEVRRMIYELIFTPRIDGYGNLQVVRIKGNCYTDGQPPLQQPAFQRRWDNKLFYPRYATEFTGLLETALLYVCRQCSVEVASFLYGQQVLSLPSPDLTHEWMESIGRQNVGHIRHVVISRSSELSVGLEDTMAGAWAEIIELLPRINSMTVLQPDLLRKPSRHTGGGAALRNEAERAISALHGLTFLRLDSHHCSLHFLRNKLNLVTLFMKPLCFGTEDWDNAFSHLPSLKNLFLDVTGVPEGDMALFPEHFLASTAPLRSFGWKGGTLPKAVAAHLQLRHGASLQELHLEYTVATPGAGPAAPATTSRRAQRLKLSPAECRSMVNLLQHLPRIATLRLRHDCDSSILRHLPPSLRQLDIAFLEPNVTHLRYNADALPLRCPSLQRLRLTDNDPDTTHHHPRHFWACATRASGGRSHHHRSPACRCASALHHLRQRIPALVLPLCIRRACADSPLSMDSVCRDAGCVERARTVYVDDWARFPMWGTRGDDMWTETMCVTPARAAYVPEGKGELVVPGLETRRLDRPSVWADYYSRTEAARHVCRGGCL